MFGKKKAAQQIDKEEHCSVFLFLTSVDQLRVVVNIAMNEIQQGKKAT